MFTQKEIKAKADINQEKMEASILSIGSKLEETIRHKLEYVLSFGNQ
jgi:hypothetical protein